MNDTNISRERGWAFPLANMMSIILAIPVSLVLFIMAAFASDAGPSTVSNVLVLLSICVLGSVIACAVVAQVKRSRRWAYIGVWIPVLVVVLFIAYLFVDDYYLNPRLGPLAK